MSTLAVIAYPAEETAATAAATLGRLQAELLIKLEDVAWVTKDANGKLKLHQGTSLTGAAAAGGALWGFLFGLLFFIPFLGLAVGAASGALMAKLSDFGIDDKWMKSVSEGIPNGGSGLFVMAHDTIVDRVLPEMAKLGGTVISTNLSVEQEQALRDALSATA